MLAFLATTGAIVAASPDVSLMRDPVVAAFCASLLRKSESERHREQGAFIVRTRDGLLYFVVWPPSEERDTLRWQGRFPEGTIAIVHTHPPWIPRPSKRDVVVAQRSRVPVFVITREGITSAR